MKNFLLLPLFLYSQVLAAQFKQDVALQRTNVSSTFVTADPVIPRTVAASARNMIGHLKGRFKKIVTPQKSTIPLAAAAIVLHAERLDAENILVYWQAPAAGSPTTFIIERRFGDPHGPFDSVGTVHSYLTDPAEQGYRLVDKNDNKGSTFYRLREKSSAKKERQTAVMVSGNNRGLQVSSAPAAAGTLTITLSKFKIAPRTHLYITDAQGSLVYQKKNVFFTTGQTIELTGVQLPRGTYHIEVVNHYNTGANTLVIR